MRRGFTLIELSIVLVIIGLIIGGVIVGKDLIETANIRKDMAQTVSLDTAVNAFRLKYNGLPGDMANATQFGFSAASAGNGDGRIQAMSGATLYTYNNWVGRAEWFWVTHQLATTGLISMSGNYTASGTSVRAGIYYPLMATNISAASDESGGVPPGIILSYETNNYVNNHYFRFGAVPYMWAPTSYVTFFGGFSPSLAKRFDTKFDDGLPVSGKIIIGPINDQCAGDVYTGTGGCMHGNYSASASYFRCALQSTGDYDTSYNARSCSLRVQASF